MTTLSHPVSKSAPQPVSKGAPRRPAALATKILPPSPPPTITRRPALLKQLDIGAEGQATILVAPAGWGKTVLLASWHRTGDAPAPIAWVRADHGDDPGAFWQYIADALVAAGALGQIGIGAPGWTPQAVLHGLQGAGRRVILIIDNCHLISHSDVWDGLDLLIEYQPRDLHLVFSGRSAPGLALHRLRAADELTEIGLDELAFTRGETAELFGELGIEVSRSALAAVHETMEGWPGGLRLAARRARDHADPAHLLAGFGGYDNEVAEYLTREVLEPLPWRTREQLVRLSVLSPLTGELADAVTGKTNGGRLLERLCSDNALVERLAGRVPWYRIRPLLAAVLQRGYASLPQSERDGVHVRAAQWYDQHEMPLRAIHHWLSARAWEEAGRVVVNHVEKLACLDEPVPADAAPPAPDLGVLRGSQPVAFAVAATRVHRGDLLGADALLDLRSDSGAQDWSSRVASTVLRVAEARRTGDVDALRGHADQLIGLADATDVPDPGARDELTALGLLARGSARAWQGDLASSDADVTAAIAVARRACLNALLAVCTSWLSLVGVRQRRFSEGKRLAESALHAAESYPWAPSAICGPAQAALATVHLARDHPEAARHWLGVARPTAATDPPLAAFVAILDSRLCYRTGDALAASHVLRAFRRDHDTGRLPSDVVSEITMLEAEYLAAQGLLAAARTRFARAEIAADTPRARLTEARLLYGEHALQQAQDVLTGAVEQAESTRPDLVIEMLLLQAQLSYLLSRPLDASTALEAACELAADEDVRLPFHELATSLRPMLREHLGRGSAQRTFINELLSADPAAVVTAASLSPGQAVEPLTKRERRVLWYLPSKLSNAEIADDMYVSLNTVKTHIKNIYRKLDVSGRREAVARARHLDLL